MSSPEPTTPTSTSFDPSDTSGSNPSLSDSSTSNPDTATFNPTDASGSNPILPSHSDIYTSATATTTPGTNTDTPAVVNYWFIFVAIALVAVVVGSWAFLRKRRRALEHNTLYRRSALSRDLANDDSTRGWTYGGRDGFGLGALMRREQRGRDEENLGLDERGEAPPPYKPSDEGEGGHTAAARAGSSETPEVTIPMRTIGRVEVGLKPPDYSETVARETEVVTDSAGRGSSAAVPAAAAAPSRTQ